MDDYISKSSVCEILADIYPTDGEKVVEVKEINKAYEEIIHLPSAQPERIVARQIRWMEIKEKPGFRSYTPHCKCSNCGHELDFENINYCYFCGARFVAKEDTDE